MSTVAGTVPPTNVTVQVKAPAELKATGNQASAEKAFDENTSPVTALSQDGTTMSLTNLVDAMENYCDLVGQKDPATHFLKFAAHYAERAPEQWKKQPPMVRSLAVREAYRSHLERKDVQGLKAGEALPERRRRSLASMSLNKAVETEFLFKHETVLPLCQYLLRVVGGRQGVNMAQFMGTMRSLDRFSARNTALIDEYGKAFRQFCRLMMEVDAEFKAAVTADPGKLLTPPHVREFRRIPKDIRRAFEVSNEWAKAAQLDALSMLRETAASNHTLRPQWGEWGWRHSYPPVLRKLNKLDHRRFAYNFPIRVGMPPQEFAEFVLNATAKNPTVLLKMSSFERGLHLIHKANSARTWPSKHRN